MKSEPSLASWLGAKKYSPSADQLESHVTGKDLQRRGFRFVGSTICYAYMQAAGMVNDHTTDCFRYREVNR